MWGRYSVRRAASALEKRMNTKLEPELRKQMPWFFTAQVALSGALAAVIKLL